MVYITGDIHGDLKPIYDLFKKHEPKEDDIIVILGDVGVNYSGSLNDIIMKDRMKKMKTVFFCIYDPFLRIFNYFFVISQP